MRHFFKANIFILLLTSVFMASCTKEDTNPCIQGEGAIVTRTLSVTNFSGIDLAGASNVTISQGTEQQVIATGHSNIIDLVSTSVSGDVWSIRLVDGCYDNYELSFQITVPNIEDIVLSGSGNIVVNDFTDQGDLAVVVSGSGNIDFDSFDGCENASFSISGSGQIRGLEDFADLKNLNIVISGSGNFNGFPIETENCMITISGSGNCEVSVRDELIITISGSGNVFYKGMPIISSTITGSGEVIDAN